LLLTKHVTKKEENRDFITLHVYSVSEEKRIFYPDNAFLRGYYINSPHYLVRFNVSKGVNR